MGEEKKKKKRFQLYLLLLNIDLSPLTQMFIINSVSCCFKSIRTFPIIFSAPVAAKRPQKPRRLKKPRSSAPVSPLGRPTFTSCAELFIKHLVKCID